MRLTGSPETTNEGFSSRVISLHWEYCRPPGVIVRRSAKFGTPYAEHNIVALKTPLKLCTKSEELTTMLLPFAFTSPAAEAGCGVAFL